MLSQGLERVKNKVVQENLKGISSKMSQKGWKDSQGREGKVSPLGCLHPLLNINTAGPEWLILL